MSIRLEVRLLESLVSDLRRGNLCLPDHDDAENDALMECAGSLLFTNQPPPTLVCRWGAIANTVVENGRWLRHVDLAFSKVHILYDTETRKACTTLFASEDTLPLEDLLDGYKLRSYQIRVGRDHETFDLRVRETDKLACRLSRFVVPVWVIL